MTNTLHAHISTTSRDCDGPIHNTYVETFNDEEMAEHLEGESRGYNNFAEIHFMNRVFCNLAGPYAVERMRITVSDGEFDWHEDTEEGFRSGTVQWCHDDCDTDRSTHRDVYAEMMGY